MREPPAGSGLYFRNRPSGEDTPAQPWGTSQYDHFRFWGYTVKNFIDYAWPVITKTEMDMLAAEGHIRKGNFAAAATLINLTRVPRGLTSVGGGGDEWQEVVWREGSQAEHADRESLLAWARGRDEIHSAEAGPIVDLDDES